MDDHVDVINDSLESSLMQYELCLKESKGALSLLVIDV